ncbi:hypothetical protein BCR41DRAFT_344758 [Lobosporangium transversale]|uniref:Uncharacterized protein n=1 Tax=Lobosporangium transversale TaxID=64571 RepID=A0A1Y2H2G0_9FUNG|nr:hypothetical protein BCR41DRAFT_344758 [Lobosporangium transversale]ORZ28171.1 hypothetical protein BCR41DRAFT_344758 [Lobosporangium transversale]|eukprot:XP_021885856.1 hypothetical protein BCR41DRAFT_344758 [Lobosporangium transversale]
MNGASGFKNGVKVATDAEIEDNEEDDDEDDETTQADWKLDISAEAVAERRQRELDLITRVEKIMNAGIGDKARDPYKVFEEFVTSPKDIGPTATDQSLPDLEEVLGKFYTLDLEKGGAIFVLESLQKRQQEIARDAKENIQEETSETKVVRRDDYDAIIKVLKDSLEREVIVTGSLEEISDESSSSDSDDDDDDEDDNEE